MIERGQRIAAPCQPVARLQQRRVVAAAVVAGQHGGRPSQLAKVSSIAPSAAIVAISNWRMRRPSPCCGSQCQSAAPTMKARVPVLAGQAGGFGVEEQQVARGDGIFAPGEGQRQCSVGDLLRQEGFDQMRAGCNFVTRQVAVARRRALGGQRGGGHRAFAKADQAPQGIDIGAALACDR